MVTIVLKSVRNQQGLSIRELARKSGVSKSQISDIENGKSMPTIDTLWLLTKALGVSCENLYKCD